MEKSTAWAPVGADWEIELGLTCLFSLFMGAVKHEPSQGVVAGV